MATRVYYDNITGTINSIFTTNDKSFLDLQDNTRPFLDIDDNSIHAADMENKQVNLKRKIIEDKRSN